MQLSRILTALPAALLLLAGCRSDDSLNPPRVSDPLFRRYVSMGNSITAGFQSAGINDSTQQRAYPVLLAKAMGTSFNVPQFANNPALGNGCPPPFINNVTQQRVGGASGTDCGLRVPQSGIVNNVAFPGATVGELLDLFGDAPSATDVYKTFILGGRTEVELLSSLHPTFVSLWAGSNDVLGALLDANPGNPALVTDTTSFRQRYDSVLDAIDAQGASAVLITVPDVTEIPYASLGAIWFCLKNGGCPPPLPPQDPQLAGIPTFQVSPTCAPGVGAGLTTLVPWPIGLTKLSTAVAGTPAVIDCTVDNEVATTAEVANLQTTVQAYNAHIVAAAQARGYALFDIGPVLQAAVAAGTVPQFPDIAPALVGQSVGFGPFFSLDGFHPSSLAQQLFADSVASAINQTYGTTLPVPVCGSVTCPAP